MYFKPTLKVEFFPASDRCRVKDKCKVKRGGSDVEVDCVYLRLQVTNYGFQMAKEARVFLTAVDVKDGGRFVPTSYTDVLPMQWSYESTMQQRRIPKPPGHNLLRDTPDYADVASAHEDDLYPRLSLLYRPRKYDTLIESHKTYRLTLQAVADEATPRKTVLYLVDFTSYQDLNLLCLNQYRDKYPNEPY